MTPPPTPGTVHVRQFDLDGDTAPEFLSADERARAARFHFKSDARRWRTGRSLLRRTLGAYLQADPAALELRMGPFGKPLLPDSPLRFNASHSGPLLLLAFAWDQEVGVDVELLRSDFVPEDLAAQVFSPREQAALGPVPLGDRHAAFLSLWTAKEAYAKAVGSGLSFPLTQLTLSLMPGTDRYAVVNDTRAGAPADISVCRLLVRPGFAASLAAAGILSAVQNLDACHASTNQHCHPGV